MALGLGVGEHLVVEDGGEGASLLGVRGAALAQRRQRAPQPLVLGPVARLLALHLVRVGVGVGVRVRGRGRGRGRVRVRVRGRGRGRVRVRVATGRTWDRS